jgi:16S rRNA G966 N2-methylase RsmD
MVGKPFERLVESIRVHGLLNPIWLHPDGSIIDGRNRYRACLEAGVEPRYRDWDGKGSLVAFVVAQNIERRHLTKTQKALLGKALMPLLAAEAKKRQQEAGRQQGHRGKEGGRGKKKPLSQKIDKGVSQANANRAMEQAAKFADTSRTYIAMVTRIEREAPEVYRQIEASEIELPKAKRRMAQVVAAKKLEAAKAIVRPAIETCDLRVCSMQELLGQVRGLDAIITDPPYPEEFLPLYGELARLSKIALKPDGVLAVLSGQSQLPQILADMSPHMPYRWTMAYMMPGQATKVWPRRVNCQWKPILIFGGRKWIPDDTINAERDKRFHPWGQDEGAFARIVETLTEPNALVCDPFLGSGTTGVAALKLHRRIIGCDTDSAAVEKARARCALEVRPN